MTIIVKSTDNETITLPAWLLTALSLHDGDRIEALADGNAIRLLRQEQAAKKKVDSRRLHTHTQSIEDDSQLQAIVARIKS